MKEKDRELWVDRINKYRTSGLTALGWAEKNGVSVHKLRYYICKFNKEKKESQNQKPQEIQWTSLVPGKPIEESKTNSPLKILIGKATIEIESTFDEDIFRTIVKVLSQC